MFKHSFKAEINAAEALRDGGCWKNERRNGCGSASWLMGTEALIELLIIIQQTWVALGFNEF